MKVLAILMCVLVATAAAQERQRRETSDLLTIHSASVSLEAEALENRYRIAALEVSVQLAATNDEVESLSEDIAGLRSNLATKGSRATFDVLNDAAQSAQAGVHAALNGITEAAADIPAANLEVNMVVSQVSAVHALFEFTGDRLDAVESDLAAALEESESLEESSRALLSNQGANIVQEFDILLSKTSQLDEALADFDFEAYSELVEILYRQGLYNPQRPVYRYNVFSQYAQNSGGWYADNNAALYGGVSPQSWTGRATADMISANKDVQRSFFIFKGFGSWNTNIWAEEWYSYSSTNSRSIVTMFRINNPTEDDIDWTINLWYSSYGGWDDYASIAVNGQLDWTGTGSCGSCNVQRTLTIPANRVSSVVFVSGSGPSSNSMRSLLQIFYNDSLELPDGLWYVDDLDYVTGEDWST